MRDISREFKMAAERNSNVQPPDLQVIVDRANRRRSMSRIAGGAAAYVLAILAGFVVWTTVTTSDDDGQVSSAQIDHFAVPTNTWRAGERSELARLDGTLHFTQDDCPYVLLDGDDQKVWVAFPAQSRGAVEPSGRRSVVDPDNYMYGAEDARVSFTGGAVARDRIDNPCADERVFSIQQEPGSERVDAGA